MKGARRRWRVDVRINGDRLRREIQHCPQNGHRLQLHLPGGLAGEGKPVELVGEEGRVDSAEGEPARVIVS